tara:strand:+ start:97 stop:456 length:360 start_codon:yes stop_codon:yes gene_type:complete
MKIWKARYNYGLDIQEIIFENIYVGNICCKNMPGQAKFSRFYELLNQKQLMHPIILKGNQLFNGGLRLRVGIEKGYEGIDCLVLDNIDEIKKYTTIQQADAHNYFSYDALESIEKQHYN